MRRSLIIVVASVGLACSSMQASASVTCPGDISDDTQPGENYAVNVFDLLLLLQGWASDAPGAAIAQPFNVIDVFDLLELLSRWGACDVVPGDVCLEDDESGGAHCQLSDLTGQGSGGLLALFSDDTYTVADNVVVNTTGMLTSICWYGIYVDAGTFADCSPDTVDDFTVQLYAADGDGVPAASPLFAEHVGSMTLNVDKVYTGDLMQTSSRSYAVFEYTLAIPSGMQPTLEAGTCYWIEINNQLTPGCRWGWVTAPPGDGQCLSRVSGAPTYLNGDLREVDLAWCIDQSPGDITLLCAVAPCDHFGACALCANWGYLQSPQDFAMALVSDLDNADVIGESLVVADNVVVDGAGQTITTVCWWGVYLTYDGMFSNCLNEPASTSPFRIRYLADAGNSTPDPNNVIGGPFTVIPSRSDSALDFPLPGGSQDILEFSANHAPVAVSDGQIVWIEIAHAGSDTETCAYLWVDAGDNVADMIGARSEDGGDTYVPIEKDMAFKVDVFCEFLTPAAAPLLSDS